ncbi:MAG: nitroreductase family protein [Armatimonadetes bacterium]|jgi:nitroreductase|nr:nitroreductase family protein [Armatimonadota bacterium]
MLEVIQNRRSVRFFRDTPVSGEQIREVLEAGFCAPSAHNNALLHAVVVRDEERKGQLAAIHKWSKLVRKAPVVLVVCVERKGFDHFWIEDGSAFMENILLQATSMGLGTCWIGIRGLEAEDRCAEVIVRNTLGLPGNFGVVGMTPLGYGSRYPGPHEPRIPEGRVHLDSYENAMDS